MTSEQQTGTRSAPAATPVRRLRELDGLRAVAAAFVVLYHYDFTDGQYAEFGLLGVELFFIISGFVILMSLERARSVLAFVVTRAARLYPAYVLAVLFAACVLGLRAGADGAAMDVWGVLLNLTMLQKFFGQPDLIDPFWTLAHELWFYVVMGAIYALGLLSRIDWIALAWLGGMLLLRLAIYVFDRGRSLYGNEFVQLLLMPQFGHLFIIGIMTRRLAVGVGDRITRLTLIVAVLYAALGRDDWAQVPAIPYLSIVLLFTYAVWGAATQRFTFFGRSPLVWAGDISYSVYLFHLPVSWTITAALPPRFADSWLPPLLSLPVTLSLAMLCRARVERPAQRWAAAFLASRADGRLPRARSSPVSA